MVLPGYLELFLGGYLEILLPLDGIMPGNTTQKQHVARNEKIRTVFSECLSTFFLVINELLDCYFIAEKFTLRRCDSIGSYLVLSRLDNVFHGFGVQS